MTPQEQANATQDATCPGCGQRMRITPNHAEQWRRYPSIVCSTRCEQRRRRKRKRMMVGRNVCRTCNMMFKPKRSDARFCSVACKQSAYRRRQMALRSPPMRFAARPLSGEGVSCSSLRLRQHATQRRNARMVPK